MPWGGQAMNRSFVIIEPDPIISMDLVGALKTAFPKSDVSVSQMFADAVMHLAAAPASISILLSHSLVSEKTLGILSDYVARGAKVVFVGDVGSVDFQSTVVDMPCAGWLQKSTSVTDSRPSSGPRRHQSPVLRH